VREREIFVSNVSGDLALTVCAVCNNMSVTSPPPTQEASVACPFEGQVFRTKCSVPVINCDAFRMDGDS
jgi:hypothetical protein